MKFALLLLGFGRTSAQDDWEFTDKLENPNLSLNLNDIVRMLFNHDKTRQDIRTYLIYFFSSDRHRKNTS